jgi:hypothetical protein
MGRAELIESLLYTSPCGALPGHFFERRVGEDGRDQRQAAYRPGIEPRIAAARR